jgi:hypothetical protein
MIVFDIKMLARFMSLKDLTGPQVMIPWGFLVRPCMDLSPTTLAYLSFIGTVMINAKYPFIAVSDEKNVRISVAFEAMPITREKTAHSAEDVAMFSSWTGRLIHKDTTATFDFASHESVSCFLPAMSASTVNHSGCRGDRW